MAVSEPALLLQLRDLFGQLLALQLQVPPLTQHVLQARPLRLVLLGRRQRRQLRLVLVRKHSMIQPLQLHVRGNLRLELAMLVRQRLIHQHGLVQRALRSLHMRLPICQRLVRFAIPAPKLTHEWRRFGQHTHANVRRRIHAALHGPR